MNNSITAYLCVKIPTFDVLAMLMRECICTKTLMGSISEMYSQSTVSIHWECQVIFNVDSVSNGMSLTCFKWFSLPISVCKLSNLCESFVWRYLFYHNNYSIEKTGQPLKLTSDVQYKNLTLCTVWYWYDTWFETSVDELHGAANICIYFTFKMNLWWSFGNASYSKLYRTKLHLMPVHTTSQSTVPSRVHVGGFECAVNQFTCVWRG